MANPRQRMKARSGTHSGSSASSKRRQRQRLAKAPAIKGPDVLKEKWDRKKTVKQNYAALGLSSDLKMRPSGGTEGQGAIQQQHESEQEQTQSRPPAKGLGRIVRDEDGNVIDIIEGGHEDEAEGSTPWGKSMKGWEDVEAAYESAPASKSNHADSEVVQALEALPKPAKVPRKASTHEELWLYALVRKHGQDIDAMHMDRRLNELQKTKGEIRNSIKRAGGFEKIQTAMEQVDS